MNDFNSDFTRSTTNEQDVTLAVKRAYSAEIDKVKQLGHEQKERIEAFKQKTPFGKISQKIMGQKSVSLNNEEKEAIKARDAIHEITERIGIKPQDVLA